MAELLRRVAKFYYTDSNLGFTINFYPYIFAGIFTIGSILLLGWILGFLEFDLARVLNDELGFAGGLSSYINNYGTSFTSAGYDQLSGDPIALLQSQVADLQAQVAFLQGYEVNYGNSSFYLGSDDTSSYQTSGSGYYQDDVRPTGTYSASQPLDGQPAVNNEESYNPIDQPTYGFYQHYDTYTSPSKDSAKYNP